MTRQSNALLLQRSCSGVAVTLQTGSATQFRYVVTVQSAAFLERFETPVVALRPFLRA